MSNWLPPSWTAPPELVREHIVETLGDLIRLAEAAGDARLGRALRQARLEAQESPAPG